MDRALLEQAVEKLFTDLRKEVKHEIKLNAFSIRGRFRKVLSPSYWKDKVDEYIRPVIEKMFKEAGVPDVDAINLQTKVFSDRAESYSQRVADAVEKASANSVSLEELVSVVDEISPLSETREEEWISNELWSIEEAIAELKAANGTAKFKIWNTQQDDRVRDFHVGMQGIRIPINHLFVVGGELAPRPMFPALSAENRVNCRCYLTYE